MRSAADIASELDEGLSELFRAGLELSLQVQADAMAAGPEDRSRMSLAFHRLSRGVRQTAALRLRLAREAEASGREYAAEVVKLDKVRLEKRKLRVKAAVESLIWTEAEPDDHEDFKEDLSDLLEIEVQDAETFEAEPLDAQIARLAHCIGLPSPLAGEGGPRRGSEEGSHGDPSSPSSAEPDSPAQPLIRPAGAGTGLLPQGEKGEDPLLSDGHWRSSA